MEIIITVQDVVGTKVNWKCGHTSSPEFPRGVTAPVVYGPGIKALGLGRYNVCQTSVGNVTDFLSGFMNPSVSEGTVLAWSKKLGENLDVWDQSMRELVKNSPVVYADETPIRVSGVANAHLHVAATEQITLFHIAGRSKNDIAAGGIVSGYEGTLVTDCLPSYWSLSAGTHQACIAHLIRECRGRNDDSAPHNPNTPHPYPEFAALVELFQTTIHQTHEQGLVTAPVEQTRTLCLGGLDKLGKVPKSKTKQVATALLRRVLRLLDAGDLYRFTQDELVNPTNNESERALRGAKIKQKRSGTYRSLPYARSYVRVSSYLDTARKNGVNPTVALKLALEGNPYTPTT